MEKVEIGGFISDLNLDDFILNRECVLKNNSMEKTAEIVVKEMLPNIQLRMMNLSETDRNQFIRMETRKEDNTLDEEDSDYAFEYVSDKFYDEIEERCLNQNLWSTKEEYKEKWEKQFPKKKKEIDEVVSTLSKEIESSRHKFKK